MTKLSVTHTLSKAKSYEKKGAIIEAQKLYRKVLDAFPNNKKAQISLTKLNKSQQNKNIKKPPQNIINQLVALYNEGQFLLVVKHCQKLINQFPDTFIIWNILGGANKELGRVEQAEKAFMRAVKLNPAYADGFNNLGAALQQQGKLEEALIAYSKALSIKPFYAEPYSNMGSIFKDQGKLEKALDAYNKALSIKPNYAEAYNNIGNALIDRVKLKEAIEAYNKALDIKPDYADAIENLLNLLTQVQGTVLNSSKKFNQITANKQLEMFQRPKSHILHAISSFLSADEKQVQKHVHNFNTCAPKLLDNLTSKDKVFCFAYSEYLSALLKKPLVRTLNLSAVNVVYHIGESHCLSYAHHIIEINGATSRIVPMIAFGAKAFHFSNVNDSAFKAITKANLNSIPKSSQVFVSFGEIDCRPNEGFISAATKLDQSVEDIIANTLTGYLQWFAKHNKDWKHTIHFVNVPAPEYDQMYDAKKNADVANVVALFDQQMKKQIAHYNFKMIDVFEFTLGKDGFSNTCFHIDGKHLGPKALPKIEQQLNI